MLIIIWKWFNIFQNIEKLSKFHTCSLQSLNICTSCHTAHIQPIVNFFPGSLQHIRCYSSQSSHNSILQVLQIPGKLWHVDSVFHTAPQEEIAGCQVRGPGWPPEQRIVIGPMASDPSVRKHTIQNFANPPMKMRRSPIFLEDAVIRILIQLRKQSVFQHVLVQNPEAVSAKKNGPYIFVKNMAQKTFSLGESRSCSVVACGCAVPHIHTLWRSLFHLSER
jgi:hypothetical protein